MNFGAITGMIVIGVVALSGLGVLLNVLATGIANIVRDIMYPNDNNYDPDEIYFSGTVHLRRNILDTHNSVCSTITVPFKFPSSADFTKFTDNLVETMYPGWHKVRATHGVHVDED